MGFRDQCRKFWRDEDIKDLKGGQLSSYAVQNITLKELDNELYECKIVIENMLINITSQDIKVIQVPIKAQNFQT